METKTWFLIIACLLLVPTIYAYEIEYFDLIGDAYTYYNNNSIPYSLYIGNHSETSAVSMCWFWVTNASNESQIYVENTTISGCTFGYNNFTIDVPAKYDIIGGDNVTSFYLYVDANDTAGGHMDIGLIKAIQYVFVSRPTSLRTNPISWHEYNGSNLNVTLSVAAFDAAGLDTCEIWSNFSGIWEKNSSHNVTGLTTFSVNISLERGYYIWNSWCNNSFGESFFGYHLDPSNWTFNVSDTIDPVFSQISPEPIVYSNDSVIQFNLTYVETNPDTCWFNIVNNSNISQIIIDNTTATIANNGCNASFTISEAGNYLITSWLNDTSNRVSSNEIVFEITTTKPVVVLNHPTSNKFFNVLSYNFNATATDSDDISTCQLWTNITGTWSKTYTWNSVSSGVQFNTLISSIPANSIFKWNVWCNDTTNEDKWALNNLTFTTDTINPSVTINSPTTGYESSSLVVLVNYNITDSNINNCYFTLRDTFGALHNYAENTSLNCALSSRYIAVLLDGTYTLYITGKDKANNEVTDSVLFSVNTAVEPSGGGGTPTLLPSQNLTWHAYANVYAGSQKFSYLVVPGSKRSDEIIFVNEDVEDINISITCDGPLCQYITFNTPTVFTLPVSREITTSLQFTLALPEDINENKIYSTNIVAMDQNGMIDVITIEASVGKNLPSRIIAFFLKFGESRTIEGIKFPVFVIYLISATILSVIMNFVFIRQKPHVPLGILSGLMLSLIVIAFL